MNVYQHSRVRRRGLWAAAFLLALVAALFMPFPASAAPTCTTDCYVAPGGNDSNAGDMANPLATIQAAINAVDPGGTVHVAAGTYTESLDINKALTLNGAGETNVTIDASSFNDYSIDVTADDVTLQDFSLTGNPTGSAAYGIKIARVPVGTPLNNITVQNVTVDNSRRTGVDLNGVDGATIDSVTVTNVPSGNGFALTDSSNILAQNLTTSNNAWGGFAIYTFGRFFPLGSDNVTITGANSFGEANKVYVQRGNFNAPSNPEPVTNLTVDGFEYTVMNDTFRAGGENFTFYQLTQADALAFAVGLATPLDSYVNEIATGDFYVGAGMSIQTAVDKAADGDNIFVLAGTFNEQVEIDKDNLTLTGQGPTDTLLISDVTCTNTMNASAVAGVRLLGDHSGITISDLSVSGYDLGLDIGENIGRTIRDVTIENVNASDNCVHGILSQAGDTDGVTIEEVTANNNGSGFFAGRGLWFINGTKANISITDSTFNNNRLVGIDISDGDVTGLTISNNTVTGNGDSGIGVLGPQGPNPNEVTFNTVTDNGRFGIEIKNPSGTTTVSGNNVSLTGPGSDTRDYAGIGVFRRNPGATNADQPSGVSITDNTVSGFVEPSGDGEGFGIIVEGTGMVVNGNSVSGNDVGIQVQEGNPSPNTNGTPYFDRGDASVAADVTVNENNITGNGEGMRAVGVSSVVDGLENWWGDASGPSGEGSGTGDTVSPDVVFCPWLDAPVGSGTLVGPSGGFATTSTDGHTTPYCTIEEAMFASSGANQEVFVSEGNWPGEVMTRDYSDSPNLTVIATGDRANTVVDGMYLTGASFNGLTFENLTITGDAPTPSGFDPGYAVEITNNGDYAGLAFVSNIFDGQNVEGAAAIFSNRGWDGFTLDGNSFVNYNESPLTPIGGGYFANYSLVFMEAQVYTPAGRGNNYVAINNTFDDIRHLNALEAFRWQNVTITGNNITGTFGRILVWSYNSDPLNSVEIANNSVNISAGNDTSTSTGIGVYYVEGDVNITGNSVSGANTCLNTTGVTDLEVLGNELTNCAERGHLFSDSDFDESGPDAPYVAPVSAVIEDNTFENGPVGVENVAQTFLLNACDNTFIDIDEKRFENPGPFADCTGRIIVNKYDDLNFDGNRQNFGDNPEPGIEGWEFDITGPDDFYVRVTTGPNGFATLNDAEFGEYNICEVPQDDWFPTSQTGLCQVVVIDEIDETERPTFGNALPGRIIINKYYDLNQDGSRQNFGDNPEPGLAGWEFDITGPDDFYVPRITGPNGFITLQDLMPGEYNICERLQEGWTPTSQTGLCQIVTIDESGETERANFGNYGASVVNIIKDANPSAPWLSFGFEGDFGTFSLDASNDGSGNIATFSDLLPGDYTVTEDNNYGNWDLTSITCDSSDVAIDLENESVTISISETPQTITCTFTNERRPQIKITKYEDLNLNGVQDAGEPALEGWDMSIYLDGEQVQRTRSTNASGVVNFTSLEPGATYQVCETPQDGWTNTNDNTYSDDNGICQDVTVEYGEVVPVEFGNARNGSITIVKESAPTAPWLSFGFSGDFGEFHLGGGNDADASETFVGLVPGSAYTVTEVNMPSNWLLQSITCDAGEWSVDQFSVTVAMTASAQDITCTFENSRLGQIRIEKYEDTNANGQRDEGEPALEGVQMFLYEDDGNGSWTQIQPREVRTNAIGIANYTSLMAGTYLVCEAVPAGYENTQPGDSAILFDGKTCQTVEVSDAQISGAVFGNHLLPPPVEGLTLTSVCTDDPDVTRGWRVRNPNSFDVEVRWEVFGTAQTGTLTAAPGDNFFETNTIGGPNTTKIYWLDENGIERSQTKASGGADCTPEPDTGSLTVDKVVDWNGWPVDEHQTFEICISGPSYPNGDCQTVDFDGGSVSWSDILTGEYTISETDPGELWTVDISGSPASVATDQTAQATITNTHEAPARLRLTSDCPSGTFRVRNSNPFPVDFTWDIAGSDVSGSGTAAANSQNFGAINTGQTSGTVRLFVDGVQQDVKATKPPEDCGPVDGDIHVTKEVHWNGITPDGSQFNLCVDGEAINGPLCETVGAGETASFSGLPFGTYNVYEHDPGPLWIVSGGGHVEISRDQPSASSTITNARVTADPLTLHPICPAGQVNVSNPNDFAVTFHYNGQSYEAPANGSTAISAAPGAGVSITFEGGSASTTARTVEECGTVSIEPGLSCPANYEQIASVGGTLILPPHHNANVSDSYGITLDGAYDVIVIAVGAGGHPEAGCLIGGGNDAGAPCDQNQTNESFNVSLAGTMLGNVADPGEDVWGNPVSFGPTRVNGSTSLDVAHVGGGSSVESVSYKAIVCAAPVVEEEEPVVEEEQPPVEETPTEQPPVEEPPAEETPAADENNSDEQPEAEETPTEEPAAEETPAADEPASTEEESGEQG